MKYHQIHRTSLLTSFIHPFFFSKYFMGIRHYKGLIDIMKKGFGFWILFLVFGTALLCVCFSSNPADNLVHHKKTFEFTKPNRKLKEYIQDESGNGNIDVDDYLPSDPAPSSKAASLRPGPIEHGTPLMPYLPNPAPPSPGPDEP